MKRFHSSLKICSAAVLVAALLLGLAGTASAEAADITKKCKFSPSSNASSWKRATDGNLSTVWKSDASAGQSVEVDLKGAEAGGLYLLWNAAPAGWVLTGYDASGAEQATLQGGNQGWLGEYVALPASFAGCATLQLSSPGSGGMAIVELSVYGPGDAPAYAPQWQAFPGRVDIMLISAHPDDDVLYFGGVAPTYAQQGRSAVTVFMTTGKPLRRYEALEGAWVTGSRVHPVLGPFPDSHNPSDNTDIGPLQRNWPKEKVLSFLVEQIRKYKPSVIVTHDPKGEYGHGAHKWTSEMVSQAFELSGDAAQYPESAEEYGVWAAAKLYKHLYKENRMLLETDTPLPLFGGRTAFEVAKLGYTRHKSQMASTTFIVRNAGKNNIREFGLAATHVGEDSAHQDMFENVTDEALQGLNPSFSWQVADRAALSGAIGRAEAIDTALYTDESVAEAGLPGTITAARAVLDNRAATQADVDAAAASLEAALSKLVGKRSITAIAVTAAPARQAFLVGEPLDLTGLVVTATYSDGATEPVAVSADNVTGFDSSKPSEAQTLTVTMEGHTAGFAVRIVDTEGLVRMLLAWLGVLS